MFLDEIPELCEFDKKAFHAYPADVFATDEWKKYESYWMIVDGKKVGCLAMETDNPHELWIASTAILPEFRKNGLGTKMKQWEIDYAKSHGFPRIGTLMRQSNYAIIRLNEKFAFKKRWTKRRYSDPDEAGVEMQFDVPLPTCPKCGKTLRTHRAKQCSCGADWR